MKVYCRVENSLSRNLSNGKGGFEIKTFQFAPGEPTEIPDEYAQAVLGTRSNQGIFFSEEQWSNYCGGNKIEPVLEETNFTKEELDVLEVPQLVEIAREMGFRTAMPTWKKETLINKILGV